MPSNRWVISISEYKRVVLFFDPKRGAEGFFDKTYNTHFFFSKLEIEAIKYVEKINKAKWLTSDLK